MKRVQRSAGRAGGYLLNAISIGVLILLIGCEAPLNLENIENNRERVVRRYDNFQAFASDLDTVLLVGEQGLVLTAVNSTELNWQRFQIPEKPHLIDVVLCDDGLAAALDVQQRIWLSTDQGANWTPRSIDTQEIPQALTCDVRNTLWVVAGFATILHSRDRGASWNRSSTEEDVILSSIQFVDEQQGYITGEFGTVMMTRDGGENWVSLPPLSDDLYPLSAYFTDNGEGWISGLQGIILHTQDYGQQWVQQETPTEMPLYAITEFDRRLYAVGEQGVLLSLQQDRWRLVQHDNPVRFYIRALGEVDAGLLMAGGAGALHVIEPSSLLGDRE